jgi:hypothetical protein
MRSWQRRWSVAVLLAVAGIALATSVACTERSAEEPAAPTLAATVARQPTPEPPPPGGDPGVTVRNVVLACREKDGDRLRSFVATPVSERDLQALFDRGSDVRLLSQTVPEAEDQRATVTVRLSVQRDGEEDLVERTWELEQGSDGVWRLTVLPDCY